MPKHQSPKTRRSLLLLAGLALCAFSILYQPNNVSRAQATRPILISEANSTRAVAVESVTRLREPFTREARHSINSADRRARVQLFVLNLERGVDAASLTADAEDGAHRVYPLVVEHVAVVPGQEWMHSLTLRLHEEMGDIGDVLVRVRYGNVASNRVRIGIGHVGGGLPDDAGAVPTAAPPATAPTPNTNPVTAGTLTTSDVQIVIAQAVSAAVALGRPVTVAVTDKEGNVLGVFTMTGAPPTTQFRGNSGFNQQPNASGLVQFGLEGLNLPPFLMPVRRAAITKAGTASFFSTQGNAFTPRTAGFIIQEHIPPGVDFRPGGPLYGVQFSQLECSDIKKPGLPFGLSADPGAVPLYKNGVAVGGVGIEGDGVYTIDRIPSDFDKPFEEIIAVAAGRGYEPPADIRGDNILVDGVRLPYVNVADSDAPRPQTIPFANLPGSVDNDFPIRSARPSAFVPLTLGPVRGAVDLRFFPFNGSMSGSPNALTASDVTTILTQAGIQADSTRAAIRRPLGSPARVSIAVVDSEGRVLGIFRTSDAPVFGLDVSVQKARTAALFSRANGGALLRGAGVGSYVDRAVADGINLNGAVAFSGRAVGFLHRPFFPDGINGEPPGPFSTGIGQWSIFNLGLQLDLVRDNLVQTLAAPAQFPANIPCTSIPNIPNGIQIFAGSVPLYKNGELVGAIGISGDGIDQDDIIAAAGSRGYVAPAEMRADQLIIRGTRLPFVKFPRSPNL